jgi:Predicted acetamidase/formamidase
VNVFGLVEADYPVRIFDVSDGQVRIGGHVFPADPMIGVIGVAPAGEGIDTFTPAAHGGNMDCTRIREGAAVYFPVSAPGALLAMGDLHAAMGDGEVSWYGLEIPGEVTVQVRVIKGKTLRWPVVVDGKTLAVIASAKTTDECCVLATEQLYDILTSRGWDRTEALYLMSMKCDLRVCQIVDPNMTVRAEISTEYLQPKN